MPTYQIDTGHGVLEVDHDGPIEDLSGAVQSWADERDPEKRTGGMGNVKSAESGMALPETSAERTAKTKEVVRQYQESQQQPLITLPKPGDAGFPLLATLATGGLSNLFPPLTAESGAGAEPLVKTVESLTSPENINLLAGTAVAGAVGVPARAISGAFSAYMGKELATKALPEVFHAIDEHGLVSPEAGQAITGAGTLGLMTLGAGKHALEGEAKIPEITKAHVDNALADLLGEKPAVEEPKPPVVEPPIAEPVTEPAPLVETTAAPKPIKMVAAAYETPNGAQFTGIDHMDANMKAQESGVSVDDSMAGFIDENGKFYNRKQAYHAAKGQIEPEYDNFAPGDLHTGKLNNPFPELPLVETTAAPGIAPEGKAAATEPALPTASLTKESTETSGLNLPEKASMSEMTPVDEVTTAAQDSGTKFSQLGDAIRRRINTLVDGKMSRQALMDADKGLPSKISGDAQYAYDYALEQAAKFPDEAAKYRKIAETIDKEWPEIRKPAPTPGLPEGFVSVGASTGADIPKPSEIIQTLSAIASGEPVPLFHGSPNASLSELSPNSSLTTSKPLAEKFATKNGKVYEVKSPIPEGSPVRESAQDLLNDIQSGKITKEEAAKQWESRPNDMRLPNAAKPEIPPTPQRVQLKSGPQTYEVVEELPPKKGDLPEEKYFRVKNERTGEEQTVEASDMKTVGEKSAAQSQRMKLADKVHRISDELDSNKSTGTGFGLTGLDATSGFKSPLDGWKDKISAMLNVAESARRFIKNRGQRDEVAATFDAADNQAGYVARQARRHVELARGGAKPSKMVSELEQKAATFVRQANGDKAGMLAKLNAIRGKGYDSIIDYAEKHWDDLSPISEAARASTDSAFLEAEAAGVPLEYRDNYVKGAYDFPFDDKVVFDETSGGRGQGTSFKKAKVFNDYAEAIAAGFKPKELRLDLLTESAVNSALRVVNRQKWATSLGDIKMPDGEPAVVPAKSNGTAPRGYKNIQVSPGRLIAVHEELAPTIEALTGTSMVPKVVSQGGAFIKHNMLVFDIFHASRFAQMQGAFEGKIPSYHKGLSLLEFADADLTKAVDRKLISPEEADWARTNRPKLEGMMKQGLNAGRISDALFADATPLLPGAKQANRFIFEKLSRGIITQSAITALERNSKLHPEWSEKELNRYTAKEVNTYYRNLGNQGIFKSKTFQDLARVLLLAPQWFEGMVRSEARGYGQAAKGAVTGKFGNISKGMGTGLVAYFAATQLLNMLTRGKPTWENDEPGHKMDAWIPDSIEGSGGFFINPLSVFAENAHDAIKYTERGEEPLDVMAQIAGNKQHPQVRALRDLFEGKDFFGRPLHGMDRVTAAAKEVAPIPIFARTGGYKGGTERQILSTAGIKATVAPSQTNNVYAMADAFKKENNIPQKETGESEYAKLRRALQNGDTELAQEEYQNLLKTKRPFLISDYFAKYPRKPLTGSIGMENKFKKTLDRGQMDIYNASLREREEISKLFKSLKK